MILMYIILGLLLVNFVVYFGYPISIAVINKHARLVPHKFQKSQSAFHIVPLFNEEKVIRKKIENCLQINFKINVKHVFVVDQSEDNTAKIVDEYASRYPNTILLIDKGYRKGKNDSINQAIKHCGPSTNDLIFFSDANTMFESNAFDLLYEELSKGYGLVGGAMHYTDEDSGSAKAEGLYWKYEEWIRSNEAKMARCIVVNGGNFVMLAQHFKELPTFVPNDFEAPLRLCGENIPVGFCSEAKGYEPAVLDGDEESSRKRRMANRQMNCIKYLWNDLNMLTKWHVSVRKVLRWSGYHIFLVTLFFGVAINLISPNNLNELIMWVSIFSLMIFVAVDILYRIGVKVKIISVIHHIVAVHSNSFRGMLSSIFGKKVSVWEKAETNR